MQGEAINKFQCSSRAEAESLAEDVVSLQIALDQTVALRDQQAATAVKQVHESYAKQIEETGQLALEKSKAVQGWLEANRKAVLPEEAQSFETAIARVGFQWTPPRLEPQKGLTWKDVLKRILGMRRKRVKLEDGTKVPFVMRFIRIKRETNVDQLKKDILAELVDDNSRVAIGVEVKRDENFYIEGK